MFTQPTPETEKTQITGEFLNWREPQCDCLGEVQFMTAQEACAQAWGALRNFMQRQPDALFTKLDAGRAPQMLRDAILEACAASPRDFDKRLSSDQLCDAGLTRMGFTISRDEFGVDITGDRTVLPAGTG